MMLCRALLRLLFLASLGLWLSGCVPPGSNQWDEEKEPHYLAGKNRLSSLDFDGAIEAFEKALISNPRSASAHLQLGLLYEEKRNDYAAAIYHFQKHLELRPKSNYAEMIKQHVVTCKLELARAVSFAMVSQQVQDEIRKLNSTNTALQEQVEELKRQLAEQEIAYSNKLAAVLQAARQVPPANRVSPPAPTVERRNTPSQEPARVWRPAQVPARFTPAPSRPVSYARVHPVRKGDTMSSIARRYNVSLSALLSANPGVEPRRMKPGDIIRIPPR